MKHFLSVILILLTTVCYAQKYALIDKKMRLPVTYSNSMTVEDNFNGYFPVDKSKLNEFINEVDKIAKLLADTKRKPETLDLVVGSTTFHGLRVSSPKEERMDIVLSTDYDASKVTMHLSDPKISNASNVYFITTWLRYLRSYIK